MGEPSVAWTDEFTSLAGLDQLGMRVASEGQYTPLIDFTTTVTWHPRYCSALAWAVREAYRETVVDGERVERSAWRRAVRRRDYLTAAATLADHPEASAIIGVDRLMKRIQSAITADVTVPLGHDHIGRQDQGAGSLDVYGGTMTALGLIVEKDGIVGATPAGRRLADAFEHAARENGLLHLLGLQGAAVPTLASAGAVCGLDYVARRAVSHPEVTQELEALRDVVLDWRGFATKPRVRNRILTVGLILACHEYQGADGLDLDRFREIILLGGARGRAPLRLPTAFRPVLDAWQVYQAHANAILALETLLALGLMVMRDDGARAIVPRVRVLDDLLAAVALGTEAGSPPPPNLQKFWSMPLADVVGALDPLVRASNSAPAAETTLAETIGRRVPRSGVVKNREATTHDAALLFLWTVSRLRSMGDLVTSAWSGSSTRWRRPPSALVSHVERALSRGITAGEYLREVCDDLVLRQHSMNARRKLAQDPSRSTALFLANGTEVEGLGLHGAGTTNPRFVNAVSYLVDLGYLTPDPPRLLTAEGRALLERITAEAAA